MNHISEDYFMTGMSPRQAWGYIEQLQNTVDKCEGKIFELYDVIEKLDVENKEYKMKTNEAPDKKTTMQYCPTCDTDTFHIQDKPGDLTRCSECGTENIVSGFY